MNPVSALILIVLCAMVFVSTPRGALLALLAGVLYLSQSQAINIGLNLFPTRVLELALLARVTIRREWPFIRLTALDKAFIALYVYTTVVFLLRSREDQVVQVGAAVDAFLVYFSCRALLDTPENFRWLLRSFVLLLIPFVAIVVMERVSGRDPLAFMGWGGAGVWVRDDGVRCFGSFRHPSLLGTIGVSFIPLLIGMVFTPKDRKRAVLGIVLCVIIVWAANSGGPITGVAFGSLAWLCWKIKTKMRAVRWGIVVFVALAAILMKAPVWYLVAHISAITGGDGWHRSYLMDVTFQNLDKWWLFGMPYSETAGWFPYTLAATGGADITNQFVAFGLTAGLGSLALFVLVLTRAFKALGNALEAMRVEESQNVEAEVFLWGLGCMLSAHIVNWLGITYFDQTYVFWFAQLAAISTMSEWYLKAAEIKPAASDEDFRVEMPSRRQVMAQ
jgi:hypothetical protein